MKYFGSVNEFKEQRDKELLKAYREAIAAAKYIANDEIFTEIVNKPATRFWVSEERTMIVISQMLKGKKNVSVSRQRMEMYTEIFKRVKALMAAHPHQKLSSLVRMVIQQPAPKFYITPGTAKVVIHQAKKKWIKGQRKKLRHLY